MASGAITAMQPRAAPKRPLTCRKGRTSRRVRGQAQLLRHAVLLPQRQAEVEQLGLPGADQPRQRDGGAHVGQRIVRLRVGQTVGGADLFEPEGGQAVIAQRPVDALGPQRVGAARHVQQVPAAAAVPPFAPVGVDEVAPQQEARHLVVEADGVVARADGAGLGRARRLMLLGEGGARPGPWPAHSCGVMPVIRQASGSGR
jgi:hypothetical protein